MIIGRGHPEKSLAEQAVRTILSEALGSLNAQRILVIIPDATRTAPIPLFFRLLHELLAPQSTNLDFLVALGTHPLMSQEALLNLVGITSEERNGRYKDTGIFNHRWDLPDQFVTLSTIPGDEIHHLTGGRMSKDVPVTINRMILDYDALLIVGPTYPHEVVGFSGGNKYFFPGISGSEMIHITHWLGALISSRALIGTPDTPVRALIDRAAECIPQKKLCASLVVKGPALHGLFVGSPEEAWRNAARLSDKIHIHRTGKLYNRALAVIPTMYDDLWTGAKGMYKLEPVIADGGEIILYAPHITTLSYTHGQILHQIGYHGTDYFLKQWDQFSHLPWTVLAHSAHVRGEVQYDSGVETSRIRVTLASQVPRTVCERLALGYLDPDTINIAEWVDQHDVLFVPKAGEHLYRV